MTQAELDRAVARATGDSVSTIRGLGFQLAVECCDDGDDADERSSAVDFAEMDVDDGPLVFDWDVGAAVSLEEYLAAAA